MKNRYIVVIAAAVVVVLAGCGTGKVVQSTVTPSGSAVAVSTPSPTVTIDPRINEVVSDIHQGQLYLEKGQQALQHNKTNKVIYSLEDLAFKWGNKGIKLSNAVGVYKMKSHQAKLAMAYLNLESAAAKKWDLGLSYLANPNVPAMKGYNETNQSAPLLKKADKAYQAYESYVASPTATTTP
jgi:hypothetical protein